MNILLDTNIIIDWYTNGPSVSYLEDKVNERGTELSTSIICAIEFLSKAREKEQKSFCSLINQREITLYPLTGLGSANNIAGIRKKTGLTLPDSIILHTASINKCLLITRDKELHQKGRQACSIKFIQ
ncbi:MAG TPA: PIN domain-containing protein [Nitrospinota bacterium]|nr:PIN domain-containing protein [Nitrospinota bacterium]